MPLKQLEFAAFPKFWEFVKFSSTLVTAAVFYMKKRFVTICVQQHIIYWCFFSKLFIPMLEDYQ